jgi:hypothetical protein
MHMMKLNRIASLIAHYAECALGCRIVPIGSRERGLLRSPDMVDIRSTPNIFAGRTTLGSGQATVIVSTFSVNSDSLIFTGQQHLTAQSSGFASAVCVRSISPGQGFVLGWSDNVSRAFDATVMWEVKRTS